MYPLANAFGATGVGYTDNSVSPPVGYLFSFGGNTPSSLYTECYKYNVTTNTWTSIASLPDGRESAASAIVGNFIYIIGGNGAVGGATNTVYRYDIVNNTWSTVAPIPLATSYGKAVGYGTNFIYFAGGQDDTTLAFSTVYLYDIQLNTWTLASSMPAGREKGAFSRTGNKLVYVAGQDTSKIDNSVFVGTISESNPAVITWETKSPYPGGNLWGLDGAPWGPNGIIVAGGLTGSYTLPGQCYVYYPGNDTWTQKPDDPLPVYYPILGTVDLSDAGVHTWKLIVVKASQNYGTQNGSMILTETFTAPAVTGAITNVSGCFGNTNGAIGTLVSGGIAPYSYLWNNLATTSYLTGIAAGDYSVTVTDAAIATTVGNWVVAQPSGLSLSAAITNASCPTGNDGSINITATGGTTAYGYLWSNSATTEDLTGLAPGNYSITVTDANNCTKTGSWNIGQVSAVCANISVAGNITTAVCNNATNNITVAGGGTYYSVMSPDGDATFIAGVNINFKEGTTVQPGGKMHGYISTGGYCGAKAPSIASVAAGAEETPVWMEGSSFTLFPNPTTGNFVLMQKGDKAYGIVNVEVYSMRGEKVLKAVMIGERQHEFNLSGLPSGLYFVKVIGDGYVETIKLVLTR
jgi:hypothetical protein